MHTEEGLGRCCVCMPRFLHAIMVQFWLPASMFLGFEHRRFGWVALPHFHILGKGRSLGLDGSGLDGGQVLLPKKRWGLVYYYCLALAIRKWRV